MSAIEADGRVQDTVERVATITALPARHETQTLPALLLSTWAQIVALITPPDIWSDRRPSLRDLWLYARYGRWTDARGPLRVAGAIYATLAGLATGVLYLLAWTIERPSRFAIAAALVGLIKLAF